MISSDHEGSEELEIEFWRREKVKRVSRRAEDTYIGCAHVTYDERMS